MKLLGAIASPYVHPSRHVRPPQRRRPAARGDPGGGTPTSPEYRAMTPIGKMPALVVGDRVIPESEVICEYLEDTHPEPSGLPADCARSCDLAADFSHHRPVRIAPHTSTMFRQMNPAARDQEVVDATIGEFEKAFGYLEHFMAADGPFCVGDAPNARRLLTSRRT